MFPSFLPSVLSYASRCLLDSFARICKQSFFSGLKPGRVSFPKVQEKLQILVPRRFVYSLICSQAPSIILSGITVAPKSRFTHQQNSCSSHQTQKIDSSLSSLSCCTSSAAYGMQSGRSYTLLLRCGTHTVQQNLANSCPVGVALAPALAPATHRSGGSDDHVCTRNWCCDRTWDFTLVRMSERATMVLFSWWHNVQRNLRGARKHSVWCQCVCAKTTDPVSRSVLSTPWRPSPTDLPWTSSIGSLDLGCMRFHRCQAGFTAFPAPRILNGFSIRQFL